MARGGKRPGAGRKPKGQTSPSLVTGQNLKAALAAPAPTDIEIAAQAHASAALATLVQQLQVGDSESGRVRAAKEILDRAYGRPSSEAGGLEQMQLFQIGAATVVQAKAIREEARKYASLAIETLRKIAADGVQEAARISAAKAMLERAIGTVTPARLQSGLSPDPGKKEQQQRAASEAVATSKYATPAAPGTTTVQ